MADQAPLIKSKLRTTTLQAFAYRSFRAMINEQLKVTDVFATCVTCRNFQGNNYWCKKYQQYPPPHVIANSCIIGYDDIDEIPF